MFTDGEGNNGGLYELVPDVNWTLVESKEADGKWIEGSGYAEALKPEASTIALSDTLTMVDMTLSEYAQVTEMDVSMTGYGCKTVDESGNEIDLGTAWSGIKDEAGV